MFVMRTTLLMAGGGELTLTVTRTAPVPAGEALSVAVTVNVNVPALVGVPDKEPSLASVSPGGAAPLVTDQVNGGEPPLATLN